MDTFNNTNPYENLSPEELSPREKQLLQNHLDREKSARWRKVAGPKPPAFFSAKNWVLWLVAALLIAALYWGLGRFSSATSPKPQILASRTDLIEYPFENVIVRGKQVLPGFVHSAAAVAAYNKKDYQTALREADAGDHFFKAVCLLEMNQAEKAIAEFAALKNATNDEFFYYQGVAFQDAGRKTEAINAFNRLLESKTVRPYFQADVQERIKKMQGQ